MKDEAFVRLFAGSGRRELGDGLELCVVPAFAVLQARREALDACGEDEQALGIWMNACLLARAIYRDGARAFSGGEALMRAASAEQIERWTEEYAALCREENPACSEENAKKAMQALSQEDYERLKWRVLRAFGVLPGEARARRMTDREYLYCAAQMMPQEGTKGLRAGEVMLFSKGASVKVSNDGKILLNGDVYVQGDLYVNGQKMEVP